MTNEEHRKSLLARVDQAGDSDVVAVIVGLEWINDPYAGLYRGPCPDCKSRSGKVFSAKAARRILEGVYCTSKRGCHCGLIFMSKYEAERRGIKVEE